MAFSASGVIFASVVRFMKSATDSPEAKRAISMGVSASDRLTTALPSVNSAIATSSSRLRGQRVASAVRPGAPITAPSA